MHHFESISSFEDPALAPYRTLRQQADHWRERLFVAEGDKVVARLLASGWPVRSMVLPSSRLAEFEPALRERTNPIRVYTAEKRVLEGLTGFAMYQGVMAVGEVPAAPRTGDFLRAATRPLLLVAVDGVSSADNMGTIVRTAAAFGATGLVQGETSCSPFLRRAVRNSMGAVFRLPVLEPGSLCDLIRELRATGVRCLVTDPHADTPPPSSLDLSSDICLVLGSEGDGVSPQVRAACDGSVSIRMASGVDSLNVNAAAAAFLYEAARQRGRA